MAFALQSDADGGSRPEINTTPLIDVLLVLMVMLIVTIPPVRNAVTLDTPAPSGSATADRAVVDVQIDFDGSLFWNGEPVSVDEMEARMAAEGKRIDQAEVHVEPHRMASYAMVAKVMASAQRNGVQALGVTGGT